MPLSPALHRVGRKALVLARAARWPWSLAVALFTFAVPIAHPGMSLAMDWDQFNSFSHILHSSVWRYHTWPLHDPWACGGNDLWANPQQRQFSPLVLLDLGLPAHLANLASLVVLAFVGHYLAIRLFEEVGASRRSAVTCASLWIMSSWFGLHFAVGHIAFGMIQLVPGVALCALRIDRPAAQVGLVALLVLCFLSGGTYAAIFSAYAAASLAPVYWPRLRLVMGQIRSDRRTRWRILVLISSVLAFAALRVLPALMTGARTRPEREVIQPSLELLARMLFDPSQLHDASLPGGDNAAFGYFEYGAYFGVLAIGIITSLFVRRRSGAGRAAFVGLFAAGFWIWVATGRLVAVNPWRVHQVIPLVQMAHVQTRLLIIAWFLLLIPLARALDTLGPRWRVICIALLLAESSIVSTRLYLHAWHDARPVGWPEMRSVTIERTVRRVDRPALYFMTNIGSVGCYEPSKGRVAAIADTEPSYRGEVWATGGSPECHPRLAVFTPGGLEVELEGCTSVPFELHVNTNTLAGFSVDPDDVGSQVSQARELLRVRIDRRVPIVMLHYAPRHRPWVLGLLALGTVALVAAGMLTWHTGRGTRRRAPLAP
jgi:hypothetical protein